MLYHYLWNTFKYGKLLEPNLEYDHEAADVGAEGGAKNGKVHGLAPNRVFIFLRKTMASSRNSKIKKLLQGKFEQIHFSK
jgi:hypothetical protein